MPSTTTTQRVPTAATLARHPEVAADWMLRTLLPLLVAAAGHTVSTEIVSRLGPLETREQLGDRVAVAHIVAGLRAVRAELVEALRKERTPNALSRTSWAQRGVEDAAQARGAQFPGLNGLTEFVAAAAAEEGLAGC